MTIYTRPDGKVFAESAKSGEVADFPDIDRGWGVAFEETGGIPPMEWFNSVGMRADKATAYYLQRGVPEWAATEDYPAGACVQYAGKTYQAKVANQGKQPDISTAEWERWALSPSDITTPAQFDNSTKIATTAHGWGMGWHFQNSSGIGISQNTALTVSQLGHWAEFQTTGLTLTLPLCADAPIGATITIKGGSSGGTISAQSGDTIRQLDNISISQTLQILPSEVVTLVNNGGSAKWYVISSNRYGKVMYGNASISSASSTTGQTFTNTLTFTAPCKGVVFAIGSLNTTALQTYSHQVYVNGSVVSGDVTPLPMSNYAAVAVSNGQACTVQQITTYQGSGYTAAHSLLSYLFFPTL